MQTTIYRTDKQGPTREPYSISFDKPYWKKYEKECMCAYMYMYVCAAQCSIMSASLRPHELQPRLLCPWDFSDKNTGVDCHFLLQGIFLTQGSNLHVLCLLYWQTEFL